MLADQGMVRKRVGIITGMLLQGVKIGEADVQGIHAQDAEGAQPRGASHLGRFFLRLPERALRPRVHQPLGRDEGEFHHLLHPVHLRLHLERLTRFGQGIDIDGSLIRFIIINCKFEIFPSFHGGPVAPGAFGKLFAVQRGGQGDVFPEGDGRSFSVAFVYLLLGRVAIGIPEIYFRRAELGFMPYFNALGRQRVERQETTGQKRENKCFHKKRPNIVKSKKQIIVNPYAT